MRALAFCVVVSLPSIVLPQDCDDILIRQLTDKTFKVRDKTSKTLARNMDLTLYCKLREWNKKPIDLEHKMRILLLMRGFEDKELVRYQPDLKGYPGFPWICLKERYDNNCEWLNMDAFEGLPNESPDWTKWRQATKSWAYWQIEQRLFQVLSVCKTEAEYQYGMKHNMEEVNYLLSHMVDMEKKFWGSRPNPLLEKG